MWIVNCIQCSLFHFSYFNIQFFFPPVDGKLQTKLPPVLRIGVSSHLFSLSSIPNTFGVFKAERQKHKSFPLQNLLKQSSQPSQGYTTGLLGSIPNFTCIMQIDVLGCNVDTPMLMPELNLLRPNLANVHVPAQYHSLQPVVYLRALLVIPLTRSSLPKVYTFFLIHLPVFLLVKHIYLSF